MSASPPPSAPAGSLDVRLRPAEGRDLDAIAAIESLSFSDPWSRASFASLLGNALVHFAVAEARAVGTTGTAVVGYVVMWVAADEAEIANIAVAPSARGRGLGARLLDAALADATARGVQAVYLEVRESNAAARALYASRGFAAIGRRRNYYRKPQEDALVLRRDVAWAPVPRARD